MSKAFEQWKSELVRSAGGVCLATAVTQLGDDMLELFRREGCEPTIAALMDFAIQGLSKRHEIHASARAAGSARGDTTPS